MMTFDCEWVFLGPEGQKVWTWTRSPTRRYSTRSALTERRASIHAQETAAKKLISRGFGWAL